MTEVKHKSQRSDSKLTPELRIAFPFVHERRTKRANGELLKTPRHDAVLLVPKLHSDPTQCPNYKMLAAHCMEAAVRDWGSWPQGGKWPIQDGDVPYIAKPKPGVTPKTPEQIAAGNAWRKGNWIVEVSHNLEPGPRVAVLQNGQAVEIPAKVVAGVQMYKSGDYGFVSLHAYTYQNETFGANFGFEGVMFTRPGEAIGSAGPRTAEQMFGEVVGAAPSAPPPGMMAAPSAPPVPAQPSAALPPFPQPR